MNHLQRHFHLPDFVITEIYRHLHQLFQTELNQEYHQTWKLDMNYFTYRDRLGIHVLVRKEIYQKCHDYYDVSDLYGFHYCSYIDHMYNYRQSPLMERSLWLPKTRQLIRLPKNYWYSSGKGNPNGYLEF